MEKLLLVDDDPELTALLNTYLGNEGFAVEQVHNGEDGLKQALADDYAAIVLDIMLPGMNGIDILKNIRQQSNTPVIMLTAKGDDLDRIIGLELGADDYLPKPCNPRELLARIKAVLRRTHSQAEHDSEQDIEAGQLTALRLQYQIHYAGQDLGVTKAEYNILLLLMQRSNEVVEKEYLYEHALGRTITAYDRSLDMHVSNIRRKLSAHTSTDLLTNIRGVGYKLITKE
ncbi:MAG: response regulator transcription factor [Pseudomonadota bacterium]